MAAVSCLCSLVVFLCIISKSCYGTQVNLSPHVNTNPNLFPNPRLKTLPEQTLLPSPSPDKLMSLWKRSNQTLQGKSQLIHDMTSNLTENHGFIANYTLPVYKIASNSSTKLMPQHEPNVARHIFSNLKQTSNSPETSTKARTLSQSEPKAVPHSLVTRPESNSELATNTKLSSLSSSNQKANPLDTINPRTYYRVNQTSLSYPKSNSKSRPSSQTKTNAKSDSKISIPNSRTSFREQRNQTKLLDTDKDSQQRPKRGWIWNQFFVLEEHIGSETQYVGKVRHCFSSDSVNSSEKTTLFLPKMKENADVAFFHLVLIRSGTEEAAAYFMQDPQHSCSEEMCCLFFLIYYIYS